MKKYIGKTIQLFPNDSQEKIGIVREVFGDGVEVIITRLGDTSFYSNLKVGDVMYYPLSKLIFKLK
tara:strand:+ start:607 stop:804 length:198 start_codon:yes stop_codon:yes gene_type:complete